MDDQLSSIIARATIDPNWFCEVILDSPNDIWQAEMMDAVADLDRASFGIPTLFNHDLLKRFTVAAMHGPGKTHFLAKVIHWFNFTRKARIPCTAPKEATLKTRLWPEFRKLRAGSPFQYYRDMITVDRTHISWFNNLDWCALIESASHPDNLAGHHDDNLMFLVEEASAVNEAMFPVIEGSLTTDGAIMIMIGNPTRTQGEFYNSHNKKGTKELYYRKQIRHDETTRLNKEWIDGMIKKYGRQSPIVKVRVFGEFADTEENQLITMDWMEHCRNNDSREDGSLSYLRIVVDVADGGIDETVVLVTRVYQTGIDFLSMSRHSFPPSESVIMAAKAAITAFDAYGGDRTTSDDIVIDSIGVGAGTAGYLIENDYPVVQYRGGSNSDNTKLWRNRRVQSYLTLRDYLMAGNIHFADTFCNDPKDWDDFMSQALTIKNKPGTERIEDLETKQEYMKRTLKSPDLIDAAAMTFATQSPRYAHSSFMPTLIGTMESARI